MHVIRSLTLGAALVLGATTIAAAQQPAANQPPREARAQARGQARAEARRPDGRGPRQDGAMRRRGEAMPVLRGIQLSDAQREQVRAIGQKYRPRMQELMRSARPERAERGERGDRTRPDSAERAQRRAGMAERMRTVRPQMEALRREQQGELRAILTPEQQRAFDANVARQAERAAQPRDAARRPGRARPSA